MSKVTMTRQQESELPAALDLQFINISADYQLGSQQSRRMSTLSQQKVSVNVPIVFNDQTAANIAERLMYNVWVERDRLNIALPRRYAALEPTDVFTVVDRSSDFRYTVRIVKRTESRNGSSDLECVADFSPTYQQNKTSSVVITVPQLPPVSSRSVALFLDLPVLREVDAGAGFYLPVAGETNRWSGGAVYRSIDGGANYALYVTAQNAAAIGVTTNTLPEVATTTAGFPQDDVNVMYVTMTTGTLSSSAPSAVALGTNLAALETVGGWEVMQFTNAVLQPRAVGATLDTYQLTGLVRGRFGTEWAMQGHAAGNKFVLLDTASAQRVHITNAEIGIAINYKVMSAGQALGSVTAQIITNYGVALKPYSSVKLTATGAPADITLGWTRRLRVGQPVSDPQAYEVEIWNTSFTTLKRTISGLVTPSAVYTTAQQVEDFGAVQNNIVFKVFQVSPVVGRGYEARGASAFVASGTTAAASVTEAATATDAGADTVISGPTPVTPGGTSLPVPTGIANGATVTLARDTTYEGTLDLFGKTNVTVVSAAGAGAKAIISPGRIITGWTVHSGNIYKANVGFAVAQVSLNNAPVKRASWPVTVPAWATNPASVPVADLIGATLVVLSNQSVINKSVMTGNTVTTGSPFYVEGKRWMITGANAWAFEAGVLYVWAPDGQTPEGRVWASPASNGINCDNSSGVTIDGVDVFAAADAISGANAINLHIRNLGILNCTNDGIYAGNSDALVVDNVAVTNARFNGINPYYGSDNAHITNCTVTNTGMVGNPTPSLAGIFIGGVCTGTLVDRCTVVNTAYHGISVNDNRNSSITNNVVDDYCNHMFDGGGIYTQSVTRALLTMTISGNTVKNGLGREVYGIYLDDGSAGVTVTNNAMTNNDTGLMLHDAHDNSATYNTFRTSVVQDVRFQNAGAGNSTTFGNILQHNTFHMTTNEYAYNVEVGSNFTGWANWSNNIYISNNPARFARSWNGSSAGVDYSYTQWKALIGQESGSTMNGF